MFYVYLIRSISHADQLYTGYTKEVYSRLKVHNSGGSSHTAKYKPWELIASIGFTDEETAIEFERYLKSGTGRALVVKRLLPRTS